MTDDSLSAARVPPVPRVRDPADFKRRGGIVARDTDALESPLQTFGYVNALHILTKLRFYRKRAKIAIMKSEV
jgi:hypothetical protein